MQIKVDVSELERLAAIISSASSKNDELLCSAKNLRDQLVADPMSVQYVQIGSVLESLDECITYLEGTGRILLGLKKTMEDAPDMFTSTDKRIKNSLEQLSTKMDSIALKMELLLNESGKEKEKNGK